MKWISCCSAVILLLSLSAPANADVLNDLFGGGKSCGCGPSCQPKSCQPTCGAPCGAQPCMQSNCCKPDCCPSEPQCCKPAKMVCLSTCYTPPTPWCECPPCKSCPPEVNICRSCCPPLILPPPPSHPEEAPPEPCHCCESACGGGCGGGCQLAPVGEMKMEMEMAPEPPAPDAATLQPAPIYQRTVLPRGMSNAQQIFR